MLDEAHKVSTFLRGFFLNSSRRIFLLFRKLISPYHSSSSKLQRLTDEVSDLPDSQHELFIEPSDGVADIYIEKFSLLMCKN